MSLDTSSIFPLAQIDGDSVRHEAGQGRKVEGSSADALTIRRTCRYDCYCKCHAQNTTVSNKGFLNLSAPKYPCTEPDCQGATPSKEKVEIPSTFFRRAISQVMSSKSVRVRYDLNTHRMLPEGLDAMRYVKHGNLEKLKMCIQTGEAALWDMAPDGWALFHVSLPSEIMTHAKHISDRCL